MDIGKGQFGLKIFKYGIFEQIRPLPNTIFLC